MMSTELFHRIEDGFAILHKAGVYRQAPLYRRGNHIYAQWAGGFVRLCRHGTSAPAVMLDGIEAESLDIGFDPMGRMQITSERRTK